MLSVWGALWVDGYGLWISNVVIWLLYIISVTYWGLVMVCSCISYLGSESYAATIKLWVGGSYLCYYSIIICSLVLYILHLFLCIAMCSNLIIFWGCILYVLCAGVCVISWLILIVMCVSDCWLMCYGRFVRNML